MTKSSELVSAMARIGRCILGGFSEDGTKLAFVSDLSGVPQVWTVDVNGGWPTLVTALEDQVTAVSWSPEGSWLAFSSAPGGGMNQQVFLCKPDGSDLSRITGGGSTNNVLGPWSRDGSLLSFSSNARSPESIDAFVFDVNSWESRAVVESTGVNVVNDLGGDLTQAVVSRQLFRGDNNLYLVDLTTKNELLLTAHEGLASFGNGRFSEDGAKVYLGSNKDRELLAFGRIEIEGFQAGEIEILAEREDGELDGFVLSRDKSTAILAWNVGGAHELEFMGLRSLERTTFPKLPAELLAASEFSPDGRLLALNLLGSASPPDVWVLDLSTKKFWQVTHSPHPGVDLETFVRPELVKFKAHDRLDLSGWLYRPDGEQGPVPTVMSFHGGPEGQERPRFASDYQALLSQGIGVFAPNIRGSSGFGKTFMNLDNGRLRFDAVKDLKSCLDFIVDAGIADPERIGIMGGSYGGFMVTAGLTEYPDLIAAGATICGIVNFETFFANTEPWMAAISKSEYGDTETDPDLFRELSPIHKIDRIKAPTIVLHGANDTNVPVVEAEQVVENLKGRGIDVEYVLFPDEGHGFTKTTNRIAATEAVVRWFVTHLKWKTSP